MKKEKPILTIVTVTFNPGSTLKPTVDSILNQSFFPWVEFIIIDGGSSDGTLDYIKTIPGLDQFTSEADLGIYDAMNKGLARAQGDWIGFMNAGDSFADSSVLKKLFSPAPESLWLWGDCLIKDSKGNMELDSAAKTLKNLYRQQTVAHQSLFGKVNRLRELGGFNLQYKVCADYALFCAGIASGDSGTYIPIPVSIIEKEGFSSRNFQISLKERQEISEKFFPHKKLQMFLYSLIYATYMNLKTLLKRT